MNKYVGRVIEIVYLDRKGMFSQRIIRVHEVRDGVVRAYCYTRKAPRVFRVDDILAVQPLDRRVAR